LYIVLVVLYASPNIPFLSNLAFLINLFYYSNPINTPLISYDSSITLSILLSILYASPPLTYLFSFSSYSSTLTLSLWSSSPSLSSSSSLSLGILSLDILSVSLNTPYYSSLPLPLSPSSSSISLCSLAWFYPLVAFCIGAFYSLSTSLTISSTIYLVFLYAILMLVDVTILTTNSLLSSIIYAHKFSFLPPIIEHSHLSFDSLSLSLLL
jgi:hypothetical protein